MSRELEVEDGNDRPGSDGEPSLGSLEGPSQTKARLGSTDDCEKDAIYQLAARLTQCLSSHGGGDVGWAAGLAASCLMAL